MQIANTCATSMDNPSWHTNVDNYNKTPIACIKLNTPVKVYTCNT